MADLELSSFGDFHLGEWVVQPRLNRITRGNQVERLEPRCIDLLVFLARHPEEVHSRERLIDEVWRVEAVAENTLTHAIAELRKALGDDAREPRYIETIHKRGYRLLVTPGPVSEEESSISRTVSHFVLLQHLGAGGMGEVYRAHDRRLDRDVAIKTIPDELARDEDRLARFMREAKLLASLNHPNVATLHGLEEHRGQHFLVMELVEGETLARKTEKGPVPIDEALDIALQITKGLEAAHRQGIVHRDLKPANVMVDPEGLVKVLDFGLAKAFDPDDSTPKSPQSLAESPTLTADLTRGGVLLGTAAYMSPEQARGRQVDKRADVWAFGCVLYEILTGSRPFQGSSSTDVLAAIIKEDVDWDLLPAATPNPVCRLLRRCLAKDPHDRLHDIADARLVFQSLSIDHYYGEQATVAPARPGAQRSWLPWTLAALAVVLGPAVGIFVASQNTAQEAAVTKLLLGVDPSEWMGLQEGQEESKKKLQIVSWTIALSPDGKHFVYGAIDDSPMQLYQRALDQERASPIVGTERGNNPMFSPDGEWIGFWKRNDLMKIRLDGGPPELVYERPPSPPIQGSCWGPRDNIFFAQYRGGIHRVSADGAEAEAVSQLGEGEFSHRNPFVLSDGETLLYTVIMSTGEWQDARIVAQSLRTNERKVLMFNATDPRYSPTGHLLFMRLGTLMAAPFDLKDLDVTGRPVAVLGNVRQFVNSPYSVLDAGHGYYGFSNSGTLAYVPGGVDPDPERSLVWVDRNGQEELIPVPPGPYKSPRLSPDGTRVAVWSAGLESWHIWVYDIPGGRFTRLTFNDESFDSWPVWSPDGNRLTFASNGPGQDHLYTALADGSSAATQVSTHESPKNLPGVGLIPASWSPDGQVLAFAQKTEAGDWDIWMLPVEGEPYVFIESSHWEAWPVFSPDGKWLAYGSDQSGRFEVYVTPFPGPGPRIQISTDGGKCPAWSSDGRELFYSSWRQLDPPGIPVQVVEITTEPSFSAGKPKTLFIGPYMDHQGGIGYDVAFDGSRFVMIKQEEDGENDEEVTLIHVTLNWFEELKRLAPAD